jgi:hypothetical protein
MLADKEEAEYRVLCEHYGDKALHAGFVHEGKRASRDI